VGPPFLHLADPLGLDYLSNAMQLARPFLKLPIRFDADALAADVRALPASAWVPHPTGFVGNEAIRLVTPGGRPSDELKGEMGPTEQLLACPYIMQTMGEIGSVWGRSRLMGLGAGADVPEHIDIHYYWRTHWRIHIPVITNPNVTFTCGDETVHMAAGECWVFDSFRTHKVHNGGAEQRVHLVLDTVGGGRLRDLIEAARAGAGEPELVPPASGRGQTIAFERANSPIVMSPWEIRGHVAYLAGHAEAHPRLGAVLERLDRFADDWAAVWARYETDRAGWPAYLELLNGLKRELATLGGSEIRLTNKWPLYVVLDQMVLMNLFADPTAMMTRPQQRLAS
jgi:Aspartyl/Asparaginyl beta-hydroxylase